MIDLDAAAAFAAEMHGTQQRAHGVPYIEHPRAVRRFAEIIAAALEVELPDAVLAAALLHDVLEDTSTSDRALAERFGAEVADIVRALTRPASRAPEDRAQASAEHFAQLAESAHDHVRVLKVADRLHNLMELPHTKDRARQQRYLEETRQWVIPVAARARTPGFGAALVAALEDGLALSARNCALAAIGAPAPLRGVYVLIDVNVHTEPTRAEALLRGACAGGARLVQLRAKGLSDRAMLDWLEHLLPICRTANTPLLVNDRADLALVSGAQGAHVGQQDLPAPHARALLGGDRLLGGSSHTLHQAQALDALGVLDYVAFGPVFPSPTKHGHAEVTGLTALTAVCSRASSPVCAIGGITSPARMASVAKAGAALGAVVSAVQEASDPCEATRGLGIAYAAARGLRNALL
ncbi:MAG: thiamine phosphate synthase [Myxococcota bacterium]